MWKIFQGDRTLIEMTLIRATDLSVLLKSLSNKLIILDLRRKDELDDYPYIIPGALLMVGMDLPALIRWTASSGLGRAVCNRPYSEDLLSSPSVAQRFEFLCFERRSSSLVGRRLGDGGRRKSTGSRAPQSPETLQTARPAGQVRGSSIRPFLPFPRGYKVRDSIGLRLL